MKLNECICVCPWPCTGTCVSDDISHQNVASHFASLHSLSPQSKVFIIISYPNHIILKIILLKNCGKEDIDNQAETYCFSQHSLKGCVILTHLFYLLYIYLRYFYCLTFYINEESSSSCKKSCICSDSFFFMLQFTVFVCLTHKHRLTNAYAHKQIRSKLLVLEDHTATLFFDFEVFFHALNGAHYCTMAGSGYTVYWTMCVVCASHRDEWSFQHVNFLYF